MNNLEICSIPSCEKRREKRGWCAMHYRRWHVHGDPLGYAPKRAHRGTAPFFLEAALAYQGTECLVWPYARNEHGYGMIWHHGRMRRAHRIICEKINGTPPTKKHDAAHNCGRGHEGCITPHHLSWKTRTGNMADCLIHGTRIKGENSPHAKLTEAAVLKILALTNTHTNPQLAELFGVHRRTISDIRTGKTWSWLS